MRKKVGVISIWHVPNYGSVLQAYATQKVLENLGCDCQMINYHYPNEWQYSRGLVKPTLKNKVGVFLGLKPEHRRIKKIDIFKKLNFNFTRQYSSFEELYKEDWNAYHCILVGSDQVWNYKFNKLDPTFLLAFLPDNIKRVAYASSFAVDTLPKDIRSEYRDSLAKFYAISVRENNGVDILKNELSLYQDVVVNLDPTLLFTKDEWLANIPRSNFIKKRKYILLYILTYAFNPGTYIVDVLNYVSQKFDYDIIVLSGEIDNLNVDVINKTDSSISEFIDLFAHAEMIITNSFHGTAFSLIFEKPLISIVPSLTSGDERQISLLQQVGLYNCMVTIGQNLTTINPFYDIQKLRKSLDLLRKNSMNWLESVI